MYFTGYVTKALHGHLRKLMGNRVIEDSLERLDKLAQEEARVASAEQLMNRHRDVDDVVDGKLDQAQANRLSLNLVAILRAQTTSQGTNSKTVFYDGFRRQIRPQIITLHAKPITTTQLNGFFKEVYSTSGNRLVLSCGYTENVRYS